eukprot:CAMPEP_0117571602 /NCGR_PEP_ID=MMETSP0784-20121206/59842_1 /TAXON_ID=39447 /ORGANISM="" /LENGTH=194 /DNA_ID=CAMNT_0005369779 /DNA_START=237 /DNA_END=819 /DNA_ORIENTATION=+
MRAFASAASRCEAANSRCRWYKLRKPRRSALLAPCKACVRWMSAQGAAQASCPLKAASISAHLGRASSTDEQPCNCCTISSAHDASDSGAPRCCAAAEGSARDRAIVALVVTDGTTNVAPTPAAGVRHEVDTRGRSAREVPCRHRAMPALLASVTCEAAPSVAGPSTHPLPAWAHSTDNLSESCQSGMDPLLLA